MFPDRKEPEIVCAVCGKPVTLENDKVDEKGQYPVHEACYLREGLKKNPKRS